MNVLLWSMLLSVTPFVELRAGIPLAISMGTNPFLAFLLCTLANIAIIFPVFIFLNTLNNYFLKINFYNKIFTKYVEHTREKVKGSIAKYGIYLALFIFVAVPLPGTGAYTGTLIAFLFGFNRKKSFLTIAAGVITAGIIITLLSTGIFKLIF